MVPYVSKKFKGKKNPKLGQAPFMPFVDYKPGKVYAENTEFYWKPLSVVLKDYTKHIEAKFDDDLGYLRRKHLKFSKESIIYIGKESNQLELAEIFGLERDMACQTFVLRKISKIKKDVFALAANIVGPFSRHSDAFS
jgi:hypothetical protein